MIDEGVMTSEMSGSEHHAEMMQLQQNMQVQLNVSPLALLTHVCSETCNLSMMPRDTCR